MNPFLRYLADKNSAHTHTHTHTARHTPLTTRPDGLRRAGNNSTYYGPWRVHGNGSMHLQQPGPRASPRPCKCHIPWDWVRRVVNHALKWLSVHCASRMSFGYRQWRRIRRSNRKLHSDTILDHRGRNHGKHLGLPTLDLGIPGRPPFPSLPSPPSFSPPLPPSRSPWAPPLNQLEGLGERCKLPQWVWVWGKAPADKRFGAYI